MPKVGILMGSPNDKDKMAKARTVLEGFGIEVDERVMSAHRSPADVAAFASAARESDFAAIICGAGLAAHLAGAVAANTTIPVIGVPLSGGIADGLDSLLSTVQMPKGVPVATVAVNGSENAGLLAAQIISLTDPALVEKLAADRAERAAVR